MRKKEQDGQDQWNMRKKVQNGHSVEYEKEGTGRTSLHWNMSGMGRTGGTQFCKILLLGVLGHLVSI